jgi:ATP/maltotriose-dependent transcriptional regulator MalT
MEIIGRDEELAGLRAFLDDLDQLPAAFLLEGEPGIGKTVLWRAGAELARQRGLRVLSAIPATAETRLSFAALADLLDPWLGDVLPALPRPQRRALEIALLLEDAKGPPPDQRAVAFAFLAAVRTLAKDGPVVLAVDDVQWLDAPSAFMVEFALRRLREDPVAFLFTLRTGDEPAPLGLERALPAEGVQRLTVGALSLGALHHLMSERLGRVLPRPKLRRVYELSGGNPFFALELARALERGSIRLEPGEPLPATLGSLVQEGLAVLPAETQAALLAASALSQPTLELVGQAAGGDPEGRLAPALSARVIEFDDGRIRFSHPLLASGVYSATTPAERRALHRRLADLVPDAEERARHLAHGAEGPDQTIAAALDDAARQAHARGALPAAAELSEQARRLTPPDQEEDNHRRTIQAAIYALEAGEGARTRTLLERALEETPRGSRRAEILAWLGVVQEHEGDMHLAAKLFREGLAEAGDKLALHAQLDDWLSDALFLMRSDLFAALEHSRAAVELARRTGDRRREASALAGLGLVEAIVGLPEWEATLDHALEVEGEGEPVPLAQGPSFHRSVVLTWRDELDEAGAILRSLVRWADERGEESALPWLLSRLGLAEVLTGRWEEANRAAEEAMELAVQTAQEPQRLRALGVRALVRAAKGDVDGARADADETLAAANERGVMIATITATAALGLLELSMGDPDAAHRQLGELVERLEEAGVREPGSMRFVFDDVEALIELGRLDEAEALLEVLEDRARKLGRSSALALAERCRGLIAVAHGDLDGALASLESALEKHDHVRVPLDRARTLLVLGATRRRARMKRPAREALEQALALFEELGARIWAEKARAELARIGGRRAATGDLTPTERRIAALVAEGLSNKEIASALFVTPKTVGTQLSRIYRKVGVHSRTELAKRLAGEAETPKV